MERLFNREEVANKNRKILWILLAIAIGLVAASIATIVVRHQVG